jgi:hypothetical protein
MSATVVLCRGLWLPTSLPNREHELARRTPCDSATERQRDSSIHHQAAAATRKQHHLMQNSTGRTLVRATTAVVLALMAMTTALVSSGGAAAAPAPEPVAFKLRSTGTGITMHVANGSITSADGWVAINDTTGRKVWTMPLSYSLNKLQFPITIRHNGKYDAVLTPSRNKALAIPVSTRTYEASRLFAEQDYAKKKKACAKPKTDKDGYRSRQARDTAARNDVAKEFGTARIGTFVGMAIGFIVTLPLGGIEGAVVGAVIGTLVAGGPTLISAVNRYFTTLTTPFRATVCPK